MAEQTRTFGYICPSCGKAGLADRPRFALAAAAAGCIDRDCRINPLLRIKGFALFHGADSRHFLSAVSIYYGELSVSGHVGSNPTLSVQKLLIL